MEIYGYGEDGRTFWALKNRLDAILDALKDESKLTNCLLFYRPSFGRNGGAGSGFGEFDFILLTDQGIYLGESKWTGSRERIMDGDLELDRIQRHRHKVFRCYIEEWMSTNSMPFNCPEFQAALAERLRSHGIEKRDLLKDSLLARNLETILSLIKTRYSTAPLIKNVLLYLHNGSSLIPMTAGEDFVVVPIDCSGKDNVENFIRLS